MPHAWEQRLRALVYKLVEHTLARTSLPAIALTLGGLLLTVGVMVMLAIGELFWAGCLLVLIAPFDMLDGALARATDTVSRLGAFLDSTFDRYAEALIFGGLLMYYQRTAPASVELILCYVAIVGSLLTSYVRARAEALGFDGKVGLLERPGRILLIMIGLLLGVMSATLWILAILTNVTVIQRIVHVWRQSRTETSAAVVAADGRH